MLVAWWSSVQSTFPFSSVGVAVWGGQPGSSTTMQGWTSSSVHNAFYSLYFAESMTRRLALKGVVYIVCRVLCDVNIVNDI